MYQVTGEYPDYSAHTLKGHFYLKSDQAFNPYTWSMPMEWEGVIGNKKIKFKQTDDSSFSLESFNWEDFPEEFNEVKPYIVRAIVREIKTMV